MLTSLISYAIALQFAAVDADQRAIDAKYCSPEPQHVEMNGGAIKVSDALIRAFGATNGSDGELEFVLEEFCAASGER